MREARSSVKQPSAHTFIVFPSLTCQDFYSLLYCDGRSIIKPPRAYKKLNAVDNYLLQNSHDLHLPREGEIAIIRTAWHSGRVRSIERAKSTVGIMLGAEFCALPVVHAEGEHVPCNSGGIKREILLSLKQSSTAEISAVAAVAPQRQIDRYRYAAPPRASAPPIRETFARW